ncbi:DUF2865 domain-containing protein [Pseudohoeflea suaedae]|uniref:DUF2865 domain-containing protein n=1 Tax=Pseudohoeflea suaedae TaxID=877384 RepID=A0A4R5PL29_9HYPH|nr:DUF2865 domain-containing protein [Pseudohoeflea suaedae]TDH36028.1 DUF2865 domain-containing protein [Pseudohoeflea suaedae]
MRWRSVAILMTGLVAAPVVTSGAKATPLCDQLSAQLASLPQGSDLSANYSRYAAAVKKQEAQMKQLRGDLKRYGCSDSIIIFGGQRGEICEKLKSSEARMQDNLHTLENKRDGYRDAKSAPAERRRIEGALQTNGCLEKPDHSIISVSAEPTATSTNSIQPVIIPEGSTNITILDQSGGANGQIVVERKASRAGNLRTVCVRSCDGYFFPISSSASSADFDRDQRTCQMMCPGTPTELFYHSIYGESEDMVSVASRRRYTEMPNAFRYKNTANPGWNKRCTCNMAAYYKEMQRREALYNRNVGPGSSGGAQPAYTAWPTPRPDPNEDPEALADASGDQAPDSISAVAADGTRGSRDGKGNIRVVGPVFLPGSEKKLDFTANTDRIEDFFR